MCIQIPLWETVISEVAICSWDNSHIFFFFNHQLIWLGCLRRSVSGRLACPLLCKQMMMAGTSCVWGWTCTNGGTTSVIHTWTCHYLPVYSALFRLAIVELDLRVTALCKLWLWQWAAYKVLDVNLVFVCQSCPAHHVVGHSTVSIHIVGSKTKLALTDRLYE